MSEQGIVYGVQPVLEALKNPDQVSCVWLARSDGKATVQVKQTAASLGIAVRETDKETLSQRAKSPRHQGVLAEIKSVSFKERDLRDLESILEKQDEPLVLMLDGIQDTGNLGAIIRSAYALGAHAVVLPQDRSASITSATIRASAGAALLMPIVRVVNLKHAMDPLIQRGVWTAAAVMDGTPADEVNLTGGLAVVIGSESKGVRPSLAKRCDHQLSIPMLGSFDSLNASVASGILLYEVSRQRRLKKSTRMS